MALSSNDRCRSDYRSRGRKNLQWRRTQDFGPLNAHVLACHLVDDASVGFAGVR